MLQLNSTSILFHDERGIGVTVRKDEQGRKLVNGKTIHQRMSESENTAWNCCFLTDAGFEVHLPAGCRAEIKP